MGGDRKERPPERTQGGSWGGWSGQACGCWTGNVGCDDGAFLLAPEGPQGDCCAETTPRPLQPPPGPGEDLVKAIRWRREGSSMERRSNCGKRRPDGVLAVAGLGVGAGVHSRRDSSGYTGCAYGCLGSHPCPAELMRKQGFPKLTPSSLSSDPLWQAVNF